MDRTLQQCAQEALEKAEEYAAMGSLDAARIWVEIANAYTTLIQTQNGLLGLITSPDKIAPASVTAYLAPDSFMLYAASF